MGVDGKALQHALASAFVPQPYLVYKPSRSGSGSALKVHLRVDPVWEEREGGVVVPQVKGTGVFVEVARQAGVGPGGFPAFGWGEAVRAKLGLADVTKVVCAMREVRVCGREVPGVMRGRGGEPFVVSLYHKFGESGTAITYAFEAERSVLRVSKSREQAGSVSLDLHEEVGLEAYLRLALDAFVRMGVR